MDIDEWLSRLTEGASLRDIASKVETSKSTLSRQLEKGRFPSELVIALSRAYGRSPVTGLIETGYIEPWETEGVSIPFALEQATNQQILDEIMRRSDPEARALFTAAGDPDTVDINDESEVYDLDSHRRSEGLNTLADVDELAARREHHADGGDESTPAATAELYAADSSLDETEERWERGEDPID